MKSIIGLLALLFFSFESNAQSVTAYNNFFEQPQNSTQNTGFGHSYGLQVTDSIIGVSFIPTISGEVSNIWVGVGTSLQNPGTDIFNLYIATSGSFQEPDTIIGEVEVQGELSKRTSIVELSAESGIFLNKGTSYWLLISPGQGTSEVGFLGGATTTSLAYLYPDSPSGWFVGSSMGSAAFRIDVSVSPVPEPKNYVLLLLGIGFVVSTIHRRNKSSFI